MKLSRRKFLKIGLAAVTLPPLVGTGYGAWEARSLRVDRRQIVLARLPRALAGMKVALVTDIHHGPLLSLERVRGMVELVNSLKPDLICLGGDYVEVRRQYMRPCIAELGKLSAPMGVYGVLGNHDHWEDPDLASQLFREVRIKELTNSRVALVRDGSRIWLCGVDDLWSGKPDVHAACDGIPDNELRIVLSHNPDLAEHLDGVQVDLLLSGHTHGGQINLPLVGPPLIVSRYGRKYAVGLVRRGSMQVLISRGVGAIIVPVRFRCPPEVNLLTLEGAPDWEG